MTFRRRRSEQLLQALWRAIYLLSRPNTYTILFLVLVVLLVAGTGIVWWLEQAATPDTPLHDLEDAFIFMVQNVSGVGLGAGVPVTFGARMVGIVFVILAAATRAVFVAAIVSGFVNRILVQGKGLRRVNMQDHVIICGWNSGVKQIIEVLRREAFGAGAPIVLLANVPQNPLPDSSAKFVSGDPTSEFDLKRAGIDTARSAIVITDESDGQKHTDTTYDARAVLVVLAIKSVNDKVHVVAQVRDPDNRHHFQRAKADEIIVSQEMSEGLLARSALNSGIANVFADLLRLDCAPEMYLIDTPAEFEGKSFQAALIHLQIRSNALLVGVVESDQVLLAPPPEYKVHCGDRLVMLGNFRPKLVH